MFGHVLDDVRLGLHEADGRVHAPDVLCAPVPALPAVRRAELVGAAAGELEELELDAVRGMHDLGFGVPVALGEDGVGAVLLLDALDLTRDELGRLFPGDPLELAQTAILRVTLAVRVPVDPLERVLDAVRGVDPLLVGEAEGRQSDLVARVELDSLDHHLPGVEILGIVFLIEVERSDADDLAVHGIDGGGHRPVAAESHPLDGRLVLCLERLDRLCHHSSFDIGTAMSPRLTSSAVLIASITSLTWSVSSFSENVRSSFRPLNQKSP